MTVTATILPLLGPSRALLPRAFRLSYTTQPIPSAHDGMTPSTISYSPSPSSSTMKSRPIEKKVSASARDLRLSSTMTPTPLVTPTTQPATRSRAQNILLMHEPSHHRGFFTASRRCSRFVRLLKVLILWYVYALRSSVLHADFITHSQPNYSAPPSSTSPAHPATQTTAGDTSNAPGVHPTTPAASHAQCGPAALPSALLPYSKCSALSMRNTRGSLHKTPRRVSL